MMCPITHQTILSTVKECASVGSYKIVKCVYFIMSLGISNNYTRYASIQSMTTTLVHDKLINYVLQ